MRQSRDAIAARTTKRLENEALPTNQHLRQHLKKAILTLLSARVLRKYGDPIPERYAARLLKYTDIFEENIHSTYSSQDYKEVASTSQGIITAIRGSIKHFRAQAMAITSSSSTPSIPDGINSQPSVGQDIDDELAELMGRTSIDG